MYAFSIANGFIVVSWCEAAIRGKKKKKKEEEEEKEEVEKEEEEEEEDVISSLDYWLCSKMQELKIFTISNYISTFLLVQVIVYASACIGSTS